MKRRRPSNWDISTKDLYSEYDWMYEERKPKKKKVEVQQFTWKTPPIQKPKYPFNRHIAELNAIQANIDRLTNALVRIGRGAPTADNLKQCERITKAIHRLTQQKFLLGET